MNNLESDIQNTQKNIIQCLTAYEKHSQQMIAQTFNLQLHSILDAISTFDIEQLKVIETQIKDQVAIKHLHNISTKIKVAATQKKPTPVAIPEPAKREPKIGRAEQAKSVDTKKEQKKEGFFGSVMKRFASKQKKASQIILPDKEPNCYFDQVKRVWIFQGEQPDLPKQIPKPPSKSQIIKPKQSKPTQQATEMNNLTAPPEFKRKGGSASQTKKVKKEMKTLQSVDEPLVFAKVIQNVNKEYQKLIEKVRLGAYEMPVQQIHLINQSQLTDFVRLAEVLLHSSEEIGQHEHRLVERLNRSFTGQANQLKLLQKVLKEVSQSSNVYHRISSSLDFISKKTLNKNLRCENNLPINQQKASLYIQNTKTDQQMAEQLERKIRQNNSLSNRIAVLQNQKSKLSSELKLISKQKDELSQLSLKLKQQHQKNSQMIDELSIKNAQTISRLQKSFTQKESQLKRSNQHFAQQGKDIMSKLQNLKNQYQKLQQAKSEIEKNLLVLQSNTSNSSEKMKDEILKQKAKIQTQLKFYQQKEKSFLKNIKNIQEHTTIIQQFEQTLKQESKLLNSILQQRIQLSKINDYQQSLPVFHKIIEEQTSPHTVILELSDIINSITQTHLQRLQSFNRNYTSLSKKYQQAKELNKKIKNSTSSQNMSLNRSVSRLKSLIQSYKLAKDQAQERSIQLELECDKLRKKLQHYKQEDKFNKSYLSKLKSSETNNQNESILSLQGDNQQLAQTIEEMQKEIEQKDQNCTKLQNDLEDILTNYEKTQQKFILLEKKTKESEKELRYLKDEKQTWLSNYNLLQQKLANQKEKAQENMQRQAAKLKNVEANYEKKMKLLRQDLQRAVSNQQYLKREIQQQTNQNNQRTNNLEEHFRQKIADLKREVQVKNDQLGEILLLVQETNSSINRKQQQVSQLKRINNQLQNKTLLISKSIQNYNQDQLQVLKQSQQMHNSMIQQILKNYKFYEEEHYGFKNQYETRIQYLANHLSQSEEESKKLLETINQYAELLYSLDTKFQQLQNQKMQSKKQFSDLIQELKDENEDIINKLEQVQDELQQKNQSISELQLLSSQISSELQSAKLENTKFKKQNQQNQFKIKQVEAQLNQKQHSLSKRNQEIENKSNQFQILHQKLKGLQKQNKILCSQLENSQRQHLISLLKTKQAQIIKLQNELSLFRQNGESLTNKQNYRISEELQCLRIQCLKKQQQIKELKQSLQYKESELIEIAQAFQNCSKDATAQELSKKQFQAKYLQAKIQLSSIQAELAQITLNYSQIKTSNGALKQENNNLITLLQARTNQQKKFEQEVQNYKQRINQLINRTAQLQQTSQSQRIINEQVQQRKDTDIQGQMQYLLKEIQERQNQIQKINQQLALKNQILNSSLRQNQYLKGQVHKLKKQKLQIQLKTEFLEQKLTKSVQQIKNRNVDIQTLQYQNRQLTELVQSLSKVQATQEHDFTLKKDHFLKIQTQLAFKTKAVAELQILQQQSQRLYMKAQHQLNQQNSIIADLEANIDELSQIAQKKQFISQQNKNVIASSSSSSNQLREVMSLKEKEVLDFKRKLQQMSQAFSQKETDFQRKIQSLERQIFSLNSLKVINKKLEDQYKQLEAQNSTLLAEKVELMRSNDNLMKINEKLIIEISPHNKVPPKIPKPAQNVQPTTPQKEEKKHQAKSEIKQNKTQKQEAKGFLGSLSSFFLTPTQTDRLVKK